jgi:NitT/TauT family transport system ATP-binding protein
MTTRPARIKYVLNVDFERPRTFRVRSSRRYLELKREVFAAVRDEATKAFEAGERELA